MTQLVNDTGDFLELGKISGVYGVKGWVKVFSWTDPMEGIVEYSPWYILHRGQWRTLEVEAGRRNGKTVIAKLAGIDDRDEAQLLTGAVIAIERDQLEVPEEGHFYWYQLEGLRVVNEQQQALGAVSHMLETGANDVMVVHEGERERLIPFTPGHTVKNVDLDAGVITVDWDPEF